MGEKKDWIEVLEKKMPKEGFLKVSRPDQKSLNSEQRVLLIRKGNECFSLGQYDQAKKIFASTGYTDGLIRLGDRCAQQKDYLGAYQMYRLAPSPVRAEEMLVKLTELLRHWMKE